MKRLFCLFLALSFWSGCKDEGVIVSPWDSTSLLDASIQGQQMTVGMDARFRLELEVLSDAGFSWDYTLSDSTVLALEKVSYRHPSSTSPPPPGGTTFETFYFHTKTEGRCIVQMIHHQHWMLTVPPRDSIGFVVDVRR
jgi:predicted secreted protein